MKKIQKNYLLLVGILLLVAGITLGFAAFYNTLTIQSSATVNPDSSNFSIKFTSDHVSGSLKEDPIVPSNSEIATNAIINNEGTPTLSGIKVNFTEPNTVVEYAFTVTNLTAYDAYLTDVIFKNAVVDNVEKDSNIVCTIPSGSTATAESVAQACKGISISVRMSNGGFLFTDTTKVSSDVTWNKLCKKGSNECTNFENYDLIISYDEDAAEANGSFDVHIGDLQMVYSTQDIYATN